MDATDLKKVLAGFGVATLVSAVGAISPTHLHAGSG